ncbi:MAG: NlpC/P60 family protein [Rhodococcus sp. (in: high G+C Gram-positive bacteria)]
MIDLLAVPIEDLLSGLGTGVPQPGSVGEVLGSSARTLADIGGCASRAITDSSEVWSGPAAAAATTLLDRSITAGTALAVHSDQLQDISAQAHGVVATGVAEVEAILASFLASASAMAPTVLLPTGQAALITLAVEHLDRAVAVYARVRAELEALTARLAALVLPAIPAPGQAADGVLRGILPPQGFGPDAAPVPGEVRPVDTGSSDTGSSKTAVLLPDGSTALAPNERAAAAVRFALDQQGTPYVWGGTTPGQGLDCSGLTQSAYGQAGVDIPRLAADQSVGVPVHLDSIMPGDLAVWDGHVAMVIGNGQMVEAGDPVSVSSVRTSNVGMGFHGFYRPTQVG